MGIKTDTKVGEFVRWGMRNGAAQIQAVMATGIAIFIAFAGFRSTSVNPAHAIQSSKFKPGQIWTLNSMRQQPNARLMILRVESFPKDGTVVNVAISGVTFGNGHTTISHLPFAESAIERSVATLERESGSVPKNPEGYRQWREDFNVGRAGIFTISVAEAFELFTGIEFPPDP